MSFKSYQKIETIYARDPKTKALIVGQFTNPLASYLKSLVWIWTEKVDGTNAGIVWDGHSISYQGRTEASEFSPKMKEYLDNTFSGEDMAQIFEQKFGEKEVVIYGELYGKDIQKVGSLYSPDYRFRVFDVKVGDFYLSRQNVEDVASYFGLDIVPIIGEGTLEEAVDFVLHTPSSTIDGCKAPLEGVVARPKVDVYNNKGERVIVKIKRRDFKTIALKSKVRYVDETGQTVTKDTTDGKYYFVTVDDVDPSLKSVYVNDYDENGKWNRRATRLGQFVSTFD